MEIISWIGISQALFAGILMTTKKEHSLSDLILTVWLFFVAFDFLGQITTFQSNLILQHTIFLIYNPLLYLYTVSLTKKNFKIKQEHFLHIIPFLIFLVSNLLFKPLFSLNDFWLDNDFYFYRIAYSVTALFSFFVYASLSIILVHKHRINLRNEFSSIERNKKLAWLLFVLIFYVVYNSLIIINGMVKIFAESPAYPLYISRISLLILAYAFGFYGLHQAVIFNDHKPNIKANKDKSYHEKYSNSKLTTNEKQLIKSKLINYFETRQPYLEGNLSVAQVAEQLNLSRHALTEVLNTVIGKNFYQFVNEYRINLAKKMLCDKNYDNYSIEAIGFECGFNSKSTFFTVFKSFSGLTPMQYKKDKITT
jgi:AraC-like DNA-binding protein